MAGEKLVIQDPEVLMLPSTLSDWASATNVSKFCKNVAPGPTRTEVDVAAYGDQGNATEKSVRAHECAFEFFHSRAYSEFSGLLVTELNSNNNTQFRVRWSGAAVSADNPQFTFSVKVVKLNFGGQRGAAAMISQTYKVQGLISVSIDGTTEAFTL